MTLYLTDRTLGRRDQRAPRRAASCTACKLYPAGATTNSDAGVTDLRASMPCSKHMAEVGLLLLVHGEVTDPAVDVFDREARFIDDGAGAAARAPRRACASCSSTSPRARRCSSCAAPAPGVAATDHAAAPAAEPQRPVRRRHPPAPTTACRCSSARRTAPRCWRRSPAARRASSSAPTAPRMRSAPRRAPAAARASSPRTQRSSCTREAFEEAGALDRLEAFASRVRRGLLRPAAQHRARHAAEGGLEGAGAATPSVRTRSCRCAPASGSAGACCGEAP